MAYQCGVCAVRAVGEIVAPIVQRAMQMAFNQWLLDEMNTASVRKAVIMGWREAGIINDDETALLIQHNELEAA